MEIRDVHTDIQIPHNDPTRVLLLRSAPVLAHQRENTWIPGELHSCVNQTGAGQLHDPCPIYAPYYHLPPQII